MPRTTFPNNAGKQYRKRNYLSQNRGRWRVQVPVPKDLRHRYVTASGKPQTFVEAYLGTSDRREATRLAPAAVAEIRQRFDRARQGDLSPEEITALAQAELHRTFEFLQFGHDSSSDHRAGFGRMLFRKEA